MNFLNIKYSFIFNIKRIQVEKWFCWQNRNEASAQFITSLTIFTSIVYIATNITKYLKWDFKIIQLSVKLFWIRFYKQTLFWEMTVSESIQNVVKSSNVSEIIYKNHRFFTVFWKSYAMWICIKFYHSSGKT